MPHALALEIAEGITPGVYSLARSISFDSCNLKSIVVSSMQILLILVQRDFGIDWRRSAGWQLDVNKY